MRVYLPLTGYLLSIIERESSLRAELDICFIIAGRYISRHASWLFPGHFASRHYFATGQHHLRRRHFISPLTAITWEEIRHDATTLYYAIYILASYMPSIYTLYIYISFIWAYIAFIFPYTSIYIPHLSLPLYVHLYIPSYIYLLYS